MKRYGFNSMRVLVFTFIAGMSTIPFVYSTTTRTQWHFSIYQQSGSRWRGKSIISCLSQMFSIDNNNLPFPITSVFRTYTGLFTNFHSFVLFSYKLGLVRTLVDTVFKINNTWVRFHNNINELTNILLKKCVSITHCGQRWETTSQKVLCLYQHIHNHDYKVQRNVDPILDPFCWTFF